MRQSVLLLLLGQSFVLSASPALADEVKAIVADKASANSQSANLDRFLSNAIEGGLLRPAQSSNTGSEQVSGSKGVEKGSALSTEVSCGFEYPYDFSAYTDLNDYSALVEAKKGTDNSGVGRALHQAKAYIALGLYAEARSTLYSDEREQALALEQLAYLLDGSDLHDPNFFHQMSLCHQRAEIWVALGALAGGQSQGAALLDQQIKEFRSLPFRMRIDIAAIAIPALKALSRKDLAEKLLASFTADEIEASSRLKFVQALFEFTPENDSDLKRFAAHPSYRVSAIANLAIKGSDLTPSQKAVLKDELMKAVAGAGTERARAENLQILLAKLADAADYSTMLSLLDIPALQKAEAQAEIINQIDVLITRDVAGDSDARKLIAIEHLLGDVGATLSPRRREALLLSAIQFASESKYTSLLARLLDEAGAREISAISEAEIAFRAGRYQDVFGLVAQHPENNETRLYGALSAIKVNNFSKFIEVSNGLEETPGTALKIIEADALSGAWMVPERYYKLAAKQESTADAERYARIMALKRALEKPAASGSALASVGLQLDVTAERLARISGATE